MFQDFHALGAEDRTRQKVTEIVPVVLYNGLRKWTAPTEFSALYQRPDSTEKLGDAWGELKNYKLVDLSAIPDRQIRRKNPVTAHVSNQALLF